MARFYWLRPDETSRHTGDVNATHKWALPGVDCPTCHVKWSNGSDAYPSVDLTSVTGWKQYKEFQPGLFDEFVRLREVVRHLLPAGVPIWPGTEIGPLVGTASGTFGSFFFQNPWTLLARPEVLEQLRADGVQGLKGCRTELRFRQKNPPELVELEIHPHGKLHSDCLPPDRKPPCPTCGREGLRRPEEPLLDAASFLTHTDLFRLENFSTMIVASERFAEAVQRNKLGEIVFHELPLR